MVNISKFIYKYVVVVAIIALSPMLSAMKVNPDNEAFVELQKRIDSGDLAAVKQQVEAHNLKGRLNDEYWCKFACDGGREKRWQYQSDYARAGIAPGTDSFTPMGYVLLRYFDHLRTVTGLIIESKNDAIASNCRAILRYFLQDCGTKFDLDNQGYLCVAYEKGDVEAVRLFVRYGMLQLPQKNFHDVAVDLAQDARIYISRNSTLPERKARCRQMLAILEGRSVGGVTLPYTPRKMIIGAITALIGGLLIKKAYDWYVAKPEADEQEQQDQEVTNGHESA